MPPNSKDDGSVNVRVAVRARPLNSREKNLSCQECITMEGKTTHISDLLGTGKKRSFAFDHSYWYDTAQQQVYEDLARPIVVKAIDGFNGTVFAYGQTGSGKTHSMMGSGDDIGIVPLMNREIFELLKQKAESDKSEFMVTASYLEIYNEVVRDLLNPSTKQLQIREHPERGIYVDQLAELVVSSAEELGKLLEQGNKVKQVAATQMNDRSSRSHSCFVVKLQQRKVEEIGTGDEAVKRETSLASKINLVDLAGSERASKTGAEGARLKEGAAINLSLSTLGQVINMLGEASKNAKKHIPYRNSKLTRLLQESLGGNALTVMIATISPADNNYPETLSTLQYASRAKQIKNETKRNEDVSEKMIRQLREEVEMLRAQMAQLQANGQVVAAEGGQLSVEEQQKIEEMKHMIGDLESAKQTHWEEVQKLSRAYEEERKKNLANENQIRSVMQNVKEANVAIMKRLRSLQEEKVILTREFKTAKVSYTTIKSSLEKNMQTYQELLDNPAAESEETMKKLLVEIEGQRQKLLEDREKLTSLKTRMKTNDAEQMEQRAEMAAQKTVLEEDAGLREKIQLEERKRMQKEMEGERNKYLEEELEAERTRMMQEAEDEREKVEKIYKLRQELAVGREVKLESRIHELELLDIQHRNDKNLLVLELDSMERQHEEKLERQMKKFNKEKQELVVKMRELATQMTQQFENEREVLQHKLEIVVGLLEQASQDILHLQHENDELKARTK